MTNPETCPLCGRADRKTFPIHYFLREKRFQAWSCRGCGFVFLLPRPSSDECAMMYSDDYFLHDGADCGAHSMTDYETAAMKGSVKFPAILGHIRKAKPAGKFFEVGCGMGYFLDHARSQGYEVSGIEYAALGTKVCKEKFGLDVTQSSFEDYPERSGLYDVIFMGDVLEHLIDPLAMLRKAHRMLRPDGIVAVEVPSMFNALIGRAAVRVYGFLGTQKKMPMPPYHVNEFLPRTLKAMLQAASFTGTQIIQRIKPPDTIALRGSIFEKAAKLGMQYPNVILTNALGICGDRLLGIGRKVVASTDIKG